MDERGQAETMHGTHNTNDGPRGWEALLDRELKIKLQP
jgi:hypothetical protein